MDLLIKAKDIRLEYNGRMVLDIDELDLYSYDRIGLVGENGAGKSTLFKVLTGEETPAGCTIYRTGSATLIPQLEEVTLKASDDPALLSRLGVARIDPEKMSGGEETRLKIAAALSSQAHAIFADEPTSHLDREGIALLINQLKAFDGALLIISHDRYLLDAVVDKIWELKDGRITEYWGNYSDYMEQKETERQSHALQYEQMLQEKEHLERAAEEKRRQAQKMDKKAKGAKKSNESTGRLGHQKSQGSKQKSMYGAAKSIEHRIEALEDIAPPERLRTVRFRQSNALELHNKFPLIGENIHLAYGKHILLEGASFIIPLGAKVALTGDNGTGKTSLFKMILSRDNGIMVSPKAVVGYFSQTGYKFSGNQTIIEFMQEDCDYHVSEIRAVLASMGFGPADIGKKLTVLSGGEMIKLLLSKMLMGRYNILLMDEPGNYLDLSSMEALERMMKSYAGTIVFISHDKRLIDNVADIVYEIRDKKIVKIKDNYEI